MMSTARANLSVGPPYDVATLRDASLDLQEFRVEADSPTLAELPPGLEKHLHNAV